MLRRDFIRVAGETALFSALASGRRVGLAVNPGKAFKAAVGRPLPDPFCLRTPDGYCLIGTSGRFSDGFRVFHAFLSGDLKEWEGRDLLLEVPDYDGSRKANYWAPEILVRDGKYYLYYTADSYGDPYRRFVRVAVADSLLGPYTDSGRPLTAEPSIDGHPVYVSENEGYLFYTGNEGNRHVGQLLVDRLVSPTELAGKPEKVFPNETAPWEEGPFVVRRSGAFILFSSRGNWRDGSYHVLAARAEKILGPYERLSDDTGPQRVLSSAGEQQGPGHNSVFVGPDGRDYICYHAWDPAHTGRYPWIAPIVWRNSFPVVEQ